MQQGQDVRKLPAIIPKPQKTAPLSVKMSAHFPARETVQLTTNPAAHQNAVVLPPIAIWTGNAFNASPTVNVRAANHIATVLEVVLNANMILIARQCNDACPTLVNGI